MAWLIQNGRSLVHGIAFEYSVSIAPGSNNETARQHTSVHCQGLNLLMTVFAVIAPGCHRLGESPLCSVDQAKVESSAVQVEESHALKKCISMILGNN